MRVPRNVSRLEKQVYDTIKQRARFVGITIDELCRRSEIAPSTFSRWVNGHHSGLLLTIGRMDTLLSDMEAQKFYDFEQRITKLGLTLDAACGAIGIPLIDYTRWVSKELSPNYEKLDELHRFLAKRENPDTPSGMQQLANQCA